jgi:hypothetical protein
MHSDTCGYGCQAVVLMLTCASDLLNSRSSMDFRYLQQCKNTKQG